MRILLIHQFFLEDQDAGGSRWNEMSRIWRDEGHELTVLAGMTHYMGHNAVDYGRKYFHVSVNRDGVKVIRCRAGKSSGGFLSRIYAYFSFVFSGILGGLFCAKDRYDVMIVTSPPLFVGLIGMVLSRWKGVPFVFEVRDLWPESAIETGILKNRILIRLSYGLESYIYRKARLVNVLTPAFREILIRAKQVPENKIICIPNSADFAISDRLLSSFNSQAFRQLHGFHGKFVITYVGAHGIANHLIQVLETAALLADTDVLFLLIGEGAEKKYLVSESFRRNLQNVRFIDPVSKREVFKYILASDMGMSILKKTAVFNTVYSNKTFDYFACKKPVLMVIDGISRKLVEDAGAGMFVEPENPADFAKKILHYLKNQALLSQQGENGYDFAKIHFDRQLLAKDYLNYIRDIRRHCQADGE